MLDREVFSCIPFQLVSLSFLRSNSLFCKTFFWKWSLNLENKLFFFEQNCCCIPALFILQHLSKLFFHSIFHSIFLSTNPIGFWIRDVRTSSSVKRTCGICDVSLILEEFWEKRSRVKHSGELWSRAWYSFLQARVLTLLQGNVIVFPL